MACREYLRSLGLQCKHRRRQRKQMRAASIYDPAAQFVIDMDADDVVERGIAAETERVSAARIEPARPASNDTRNQRIGLGADARRYFVAGDPPQGGDLLGHCAADARHGEIDPRSELAGVESGGMDQITHRRAGTG